MGVLDGRIGEKWGKLTIVGTAYDERRKRWNVVCKCDCGRVIEKQYIHLKIGKVKSCGCLQLERRTTAEARKEARRCEWAQTCEEFKARREARLAEAERARRRREELSELRRNNTRLYYAWQSMWQRCTNPNHHKYHLYGARGISVCDEWRDFVPFARWALANGYGRGLSIDRINNDGGYCPGNCRWADVITQNNNKRNNHRVIINGISHTLAEWERLGMRQCGK